MNELLPLKKIRENPKTIQNMVFGVVLIALFLLVCGLFAPFFTILLWSIILFVIINPLHKRLTKNIDFSTRKGKFVKSLFAGLFSIATAVLVLVPIMFVLSQVTHQIMELINIARRTFRENPTILQEVLEKFSDFIAEISADQVRISAAEIQGRLLYMLNSGLDNILNFSKGIALNISNFVISLVFMLFCLFFFYMDGAYLSSLVLNNFPIKEEYLTTLVKKFKDIIKNLFLGYIMVAIVQSVLAYIIFAIFRISGAMVFACLTFICVFIPMFGGAIIWMPIGVSIILGGEPVRGILFLIISGIFISLLDNILRPLFLQDRIQLHPLIIFFAIMGGVKAYGFNGIILGPMAVILFLTVLDLFLTEHHIGHKNPIAEQPDRPKQKEAKAGAPDKNTDSGDS
ncbi:MAG: AI-2E family transporter [Spirochaetaceae bacterium]|jgi:predicted PurR-regulated permease PerM|nr:AI-2E family transporter [Spirochaetaceae bacterium]